MSTINAIPNGWTFWDKMNHDLSLQETAAWMVTQPKIDTVKAVESFYDTEVIFSRTDKFGDTESIEKEIFSLKAKAKHDPKGLTRKEERRLDKLEQKLEKSGKVRVWEVALPREYKVKFGIKVLVTEKQDRSDFFPVGFRIYVSRLRRLVQPSMLNTTHIGRLPFFGTFWAHLTDSKYGIRCLNTQGDFAKYTRSTGYKRSVAVPSI